MLTDWNGRFPRCEPLAHHLTVVFPERWVRFHSLPASKRYDGGMDVLVESKAARDSLAERYAGWLAPEWLTAGDVRDVALELYGVRRANTERLS